MATHPTLVGEAGVVIGHRQTGVAEVPHDVERTSTKLQVLGREGATKRVTAQPGDSRSFAQPRDDELDRVGQELLSGRLIQPRHAHGQEQGVVEHVDAAGSQGALTSGREGQPRRTEEFDVVPNRAPRPR